MAIKVLRPARWHKPLISDFKRKKTGQMRVQDQPELCSENPSPKPKGVVG